jgi:hypothetical protein
MNVAECSGWQKFYREYHEFLETPVGKEALRQALQKAEREERAVNFEMLEDAKGYLMEVKKVLDDHGAKTWKEVKSIDVNSTATCTPDLTVSLPWEVASSSPSKVVESRFYVSLTSCYNCGGTIPQHLSGSYDELYEACYVGDNEKIQSLCLPTAGAKSGSILLNISVMMTFYTNGTRLPAVPQEDMFSTSIFTFERLHSTFCGCCSSPMVYCKVDPCYCRSTISPRT